MLTLRSSFAVSLYSRLDLRIRFMLYVIILKIGNLNISFKKSEGAREEVTPLLLPWTIRNWCINYNIYPRGTGSLRKSWKTFKIIYCVTTLLPTDQMNSSRKRASEEEKGVCSAITISSDGPECFGRTVAVSWKFLVL